MKNILVRHVKDTLVSITTGEVVSCNPASNTPPYTPYRLGFRPAGTSGPYEQVDISGNIATFCPLGVEAVSFLFRRVPGHEDVFAIELDPLK